MLRAPSAKVPQEKIHFETYTGPPCLFQKDQSSQSTYLVHGYSLSVPPPVHTLLSQKQQMLVVCLCGGRGLTQTPTARGRDRHPLPLVERSPRQSTVLTPNLLITNLLTTFVHVLLFTQRDVTQGVGVQGVGAP